MLGSASSSSSYPLQQALGPGGNAIAQAASQAIAATQALTGRRTSSLKASFEAIHMGVQSHEFSVGRELAGAAQSAIAGTSFAPDGPPPKRKKSRSTEQVLDVVTGGAGFLDDSLMEPDLNISADLRDQDWNFDPNEPRYCICNQVSYGDMVACDNEDVSSASSVSQIESTVKASMLTLKNSFSGLLFSLCQIGVCLPFDNGSAIEKRIIGVRYSKREHKYNFHHC